MKNFRLFSLLTALFLGIGAVVATEQYGWQGTYYEQGNPAGTVCTPHPQTCVISPENPVCRTTYLDTDGMNGPQLFLLDNDQRCTITVNRP